MSMHRWLFWTHDDPEKHANDAASFWPGQVVAVLIIGGLLTALLPAWTGNSVLSCALIAPIHLGMHLVTTRPGVFTRAPRLVSTIENLTNLALMVSYGVNATTPNPLLWVLPAGFIVLVGLGGRPAVVFALAAALFPAIGEAIRAALFAEPLEVTAPLGVGAVLASTYVFIGIIRASWATAAELQRREQEAILLEAERQRIARELHDDVGATLAEISLWLGIARRGGNAEALSTAQASAAACSVRLRQVLVPLREGRSTVGATIDRVRGRLDGLVSAADIAVDVTVGAAVDAEAVLDGVVAHSVQMFVLEAASNAIRHGAAGRFVVVVEAGAAGDLVVACTDDGKGFAVNDVIAVGGLAALRARSAACGGSFTATSTAGATTVMVSLPAVRVAAM